MLHNCVSVLLALALQYKNAVLNPFVELKFSGAHLGSFYKLIAGLIVTWPTCPSWFQPFSICKMLQELTNTCFDF
jgi:hypothetical protein